MVGPWASELKKDGAGFDNYGENGLGGRRYGQIIRS
jgi:hypothetical protein